MDKKKDIENQLIFDGIRSDDNQTYQMLFDALEKSPDFKLKTDFATNVLAKLNRLEKKNKFWFLTFVVSGIACMLSATVAVFLYYYGAEGLNQFQQVTYWGVLIGVMVVMIQYLDNKLVRKSKFSVI